MLEMMPIPGPAIQGPVMSGPGQTKLPDCGNFNCSLSFMAIQGMDVTAAKNNLEVDASSHIGENILQFPVSITDLIIKKDEVTLDNGSKLRKKMLFSRELGQSLQEVTNFEEGNGQVWQRIDRISDSIINSPVDSWHALLSSDQTSGDNQRMVLFHKKDEANVREYYVTVNLSSNSLEKLKSNLQGEANSQKDEIFIFAESGKQLGDFYALIENSFTLREKKEKQSYLDRLKQDTQTGDSFILQRQEKVREAVAREADKILKDDISLTAIGLLGQSLNTISDQISSQLSQENSELPKHTQQNISESYPVHAEIKRESQKSVPAELTALEKISVPDKIAEVVRLEKSGPVEIPIEIPPIIVQAFLNKFNIQADLPINMEEITVGKAVGFNDENNQVTSETEIPAEIPSLIVQAIIAESFQVAKTIPEAVEIKSEKNGELLLETQKKISVSQERFVEFLERIEELVDDIFRKKEDDQRIPLEINQPFSADPSDILFTDEIASEFIEVIEKRIDILLSNKLVEAVYRIFPEVDLTDIDFEDTAERNISAGNLLIIELLAENILDFCKEGEIFVSPKAADYREDIFQEIFIPEVIKKLDLPGVMIFIAAINSIPEIFSVYENSINNDPDDNKLGILENQIEQILLTIINVSNPDTENSNTSLISDLNEISISESFKDITPIIKLLSSQESTDKAISIDKSTDLKIVFFTLELMMQYRLKKELENKPLPKILPLIVYRQIEVLLSMIKENNNESNDLSGYLPEVSPTKSGFTCPDQIGAWGVNKLVILWLFLLLIKEKSFNLKRDEFEPVKIPKYKKRRKNYTPEKSHNPYEIWSIIRSLIYMKKLTQAKNKKKRKIKKMRSYGMIFAYQPLVNSL